MIQLSSTQKKVLDIYHNEGHVKAWNYWKLVGNTYCIFLGEVPSHEFIDGKSLANHIGLTEGVLCNVDTSWLKFILDGNIIYVPMKPLMHSVSWDKINECGAVFENVGATIDIDSNTYDITLLRGLNVNHNSDKKIAGYDNPETHKSEWNRLMYPLHKGVRVHTYIRNPSQIPYALWRAYSNIDMVMDYQQCNNGSITLVQESLMIDKRLCYCRGGDGVCSIDLGSSSIDDSNFGWRPALRFIK